MQRIGRADKICGSRVSWRINVECGSWWMGRNVESRAMFSARSNVRIRCGSDATPCGISDGFTREVRIATGLRLVMHFSVSLKIPGV